MRFLVDECTGPAVAAWLRDQGHDVFSIYDNARGMTDDAIWDMALTEHWILVTNDKDFGEKVYRKHCAHHGVILLRLEDERPLNKIAVLRKLLERYADSIANQFVVVTENGVRFAGIPSKD